MRRPLTASLVAILLVGLLPLAVLAATPTASAAPVTTDEEVPVQVTLQAIDDDGDATTAFTPGSPAHGQLGSVGAISCDGLTPNTCTAAVLYTPDADYNGDDSFTFTATANGEDSAPATADIAITPVNDPPVAQDQSGLATQSDTALPITLVATDVDGDTLTYSTGSAAHGTVTPLSPGSANVTYTPTAGYTGADSFTFTANDGTVDSAAATVSLSVIEHAPVCPSASSSGPSGTQQTGVAGCTDYEGDHLSYAIATSPTHGTASINPAGHWTYTPTGPYRGTDSFTFKANDGTFDSAPATISITVTNQAPACSSASSSGLSSAGQAGDASCTDPESDPLTFALDAGATHGTASIDGGTGHWTYTPDPGYRGADAFTFHANDGAADSNVATISISVDDRAPVCADDISNGTSNSQQSKTASCTDAESDPLTFTIAGAPSHGSASIDVLGTWTYTPDPNYHGGDAFTIQANDGSLDSNSATITITVDDQAPTCADGQSVGVTNVQQTGSADCTDPEGDALTYAVVANATHGTASIDGTGAWTYTPDTDYQGGDGFTIQANDGTLDSNVATITIAVGDAAPTCPDADVSVVMNVASTASAGCTDPESDPMTWTISTPASHGTATIDGAGVWTYTPDLNYRGADSFGVTANDGLVDSAPGTITISVSNQPIPAGGNDAKTTPATITGTFNVLANDSPGVGETGQPLTIVAVTQGTKGSVSTDGAMVTYNPSGCAIGTDQFTYTVSDGQYSSTKSVFVTIARPGQSGLSVNPITDTPTIGFVTGSTIGTTVPLKLAWCGVTTSLSSVKSYRVIQSTNGGTTYPTTLFSATTARSSTRNLSVGTLYRWRARTTDSKGRTGSYATSLVSRISRTQDTSVGFTYAGSWHISSTSSASGGTEHYTSSAGASATATVINIRSFAIVGPRGSTRGSFRVYVDGVLVKTVSEKISGSTVYRRVLYVRGVTSGVGVSHTIRIVAVGGARIDIDALLTLAAP